MVNYQLYRTNVLLGGQLKYDIIIDSIGQDLVATDFHISPISNNVPFNKYVKDNLLNYTHQENITRYYQQVSGYFYEECIEHQLSNTYPIISNTKNVKDFCSDYEMGCKRMSHKLYGKQFSFFCPVWLEYLPENEFLNFQFEIYANIESETPLYIKNFKLKPTELTNSFHNEFVNYFNKYIKDIGIQKGNDDILSIHLDKGTAQITGINVSNGLKTTKNLPHLVENILSRERPLMEFDNMIINNFKQHNIIANQLFNFNFCFNIEDLLSTQLYKMTFGDGLILRVKVGINDKFLETKDFFSNYEFIQKKFCGPQAYFKYSKQSREFEKDDRGLSELTNKSDLNVLNYLKDHKYVDYMYKNKIVQSTIHWSLSDNNDYILNAYNGFAGYIIQDDGHSQLNEQNITYLSHTYDNMSDLLSTVHKPTLNTLGWCNTIQIMESDLSSMGISKLISTLPNYITYSSNFYDGAWVNNTKFESTWMKKQFEIPDEEIDGEITEKQQEQTSARMLFIYIPHRFFSNLNNTIDRIYIDDNRFWLYKKEKDSIAKFYLHSGGNEQCLFVLINDKFKNEFIYQNFLSILKKISIGELGNPMFKNDPYLKFLTKLFSMNKVGTTCPVLVPTTSLDIVRADSPSLSSNEIEYYKNNLSQGEYILRYSGKIKPTFLSIDNDINFNYKYKKIVLTENEFTKSNFVKYANTGYSQLYPSIDFYSYIKQKQNYGYNGDLFIEWNNEWHEFNDNYIFSLQSSFDIILESVIEDGKYVKIKELVRRYLKNFYKIENVDKLDYIESLYEYTCSIDYKTPSNIVDYTYRIKITLK